MKPQVTTHQFKLLVTVQNNRLVALEYDSDLDDDVARDINAPDSMRDLAAELIANNGCELWLCCDYQLEETEHAGTWSYDGGCPPETEVDINIVDIYFGWMSKLGTVMSERHIGVAVARSLMMGEIQERMAR